MTPDDLRAWQQAMGYTYDTAAQALGVSRSSYADWIAGRSRTTGKPIQISRLVALACAAIAAGIDPPLGCERRTDPQGNKAMNTNTQAPFPNLFNAAREMIAERLGIIRNDKHGLYTQEDLESAEREHALIELEIAQIEAGWRTR